MTGNRNLGDLGESTLRLLAAQVDMSVNKANPDKTGWDFLVEFAYARDYSKDFNLPLDKKPPPIQCLVQVKATDRQRRKWSIKLSNWVRLITSPLPAFNLVFGLSGSSRGLPHIWGQGIIGEKPRRLC